MAAYFAHHPYGAGAHEGIGVHKHEQDIVADTGLTQAEQGLERVGTHPVVAVNAEMVKDFYKNFIFASVSVVDQGLFKGEEGLEQHKIAVEKSLNYLCPGN